MAEFVAGYAQILQSKDISALEVSERQKHLVSLMYFAQQFTRLAVLNFLGSVVLEIERGLIKWGDSFMYLESRTLYSHPLPEKSTAELPVKSSSSKSSPLLILFCRDYQRDARNKIMRVIIMVTSEAKASALNIFSLLAGCKPASRNTIRKILLIFHSLGVVVSICRKRRQKSDSRF